ncbi:MAG TPA: hypothetical protein VMK12_30160 [Anaeromyxobacteraceae bacterium]|nr:hypothetical protein [Anaeromyxobacteraceae bacterium]
MAKVTRTPPTGNGRDKSSDPESQRDDAPGEGGENDPALAAQYGEDPGTLDQRASWEDEDLDALQIAYRDIQRRLDELGELILEMQAARGVRRAGRDSTEC